MTRLVPNLKPVEDCIDVSCYKKNNNPNPLSDPVKIFKNSNISEFQVPKEVCSKQQLPPRKIKKPVNKKWCYTPEPEIY